MSGYNKFLERLNATHLKKYEPLYQVIWEDRYTGDKGVHESGLPKQMAYEMSIKLNDRGFFNGYSYYVERQN